MTSSKQPISIDCQIFQTFSWNRGMGKYSLELLKSLQKEGYFKSRLVEFVFTSKLPKNEEAEELLRKYIPNATFSYVNLELPKEDRSRHNVQTVRLKNQEILTQHIKENFQEDVTFLILSLYLDEVCPVFPGEGVSEKQLLYYDSIPFLYHERYGRLEGFFEHFYLPHTATVFEADRVFTISKTVANDLHLYFGVNKKKIFNIDGAPIPRSVSKSKKPKLDFDVAPNQYVLMPTGQELRKNNDRAVEAFEEYANSLDIDTKLVITSSFSEEGRENLRAKSGRVHFTGNVSESELLWLYQNCKFVLFPPEYEGLGLPILEGVEQGKIIACSDISVFKEMSPEAFYYFDPIDVASITEALKRVNNDDSIDQEEYTRIMDHYSWSATARRFIDGAKEVNIPRRNKNRKKIAIFCPDVSGFSAIGKDIGELHDTYAQYFDIEYYFDRGPNHRLLRPNILKYAAPCFEAADFKEGDEARYDAIIYHIGNSEYHRNITRVALKYPGYVILHDTNLGGLFHNLVESGYITEQRYKAEIELEAMLTKSHKRDSDKGSFLASILNHHKGIVVHSDYAKSAVKAKLVNEVPVSYLELPFSTPPFPTILNRNRSSHLTIAFAGIIAPIKGIDIMEQIASSQAFVNCRINIFGFSAAGSDQLRMLQNFSNVEVTTNPTDFEFQNKLIKSDIMINVRMAYRGETSGSTLSHMRYGGASLVRSFGWFGELPDDVVVKVNDPSETLYALERLVSDVAQLKAVQSNALAFMEEHHTHDAYAQGMVTMIDKS